jgi:bifunctional pyridoxal-dependent enzyme with beta-cystathionase and maltose regulon repressor activities
MLSSPHIRVGERFGTHVRMNLATSGDLVRDAVSRITQNLTQK